MKTVVGFALAICLLPRIAIAEAPGLIVPGATALPTDPCEVVGVCLPGNQVRLTQPKDPAAMLNGADERLKAGGDSGFSGTGRLGDARAMQDRMLVDWCSVCKCCAVANDDLIIAPEALVDPGLDHDMTIIEGQ